MSFGGIGMGPERVRGLTLWLGVSGRSRGWRGFLNAAVALGITVLVRVALEVIFHERAPTYLVFLAPVLAAALFGGVVPGLVTTFAAWLTANLFFVDPTFSLKTNSQDLIIAGVFLVEGATIALAGGRLRAAVTTLVERERQLAASEARLLVAQQAARIATYEWEPASGSAVWSDNAEAIMGFARGSFRGTYEDSLRTLVPEDRPKVDAAAARLRREGSSEVDYRVTDPDGQVRWIRGTGTLRRGEDPESDRVVGVMMDITEQKRTSENSQFLADATAELASSLEYRTNLAMVAKAAVASFADMSAVVLSREQDASAEVVTLEHRDPERVPLMATLALILGEATERRGLIAQSLASGRPMFLPRFTSAQVADTAVSPAHIRALEDLRIASAILVPLVARGKTLGALLFAQETGRSFDQNDFRLANELGRRAALAIENALLLEQSFEREAVVSRANESLQLVADAGVELSATLELSASLKSLVSLVVPRFADVCAITLQEGSRLETVALAAANENLRAQVEALVDEASPGSELTASAAQVLRSKRPVFLPVVSEGVLQGLSASPERAGRIASTGVHSVIIMPLSAREQVLGAMAFMRSGERPAFDRHDLSLAGQMARRTAVATDNARLYNEARRANDAKDEFLGMMSHELRTPITVIHGGARVLRSRARNLDDETRDGLLGDIEREAERLSRMLENLLALARAELDREVVLEPVLLQRLLPRLVESSTGGSGRKVSFETEDDLPAVSAEPGYVEHILRNLVSNAMKYSPPGSPIDVVVSRCGTGASIRVLDRGFGVANEEVGRLFERFYRSDRTARLAGGAGLGLAVCKRLVEAMSGEIWAKPREGGGLEVGFSLPEYREETT